MRHKEYNVEIEEKGKGTLPATKHKGNPSHSLASPDISRFNKRAAESFVFCSLSSSEV